MMTFYHWQAQDLILAVHIQPRASQAGVVGIHADRLKIKTTAAPVDGKANEEVCKLLAKLFGVAKSQVILLQGHTSRDKRFCIHAPKQLPEFISRA
jgi:uncharacterized protein